MNTTLIGRAGEARAAEYLRSKHYEILAAGYHSRYGEIDLIASDKKTVVFVEVKLRKNDRFAPAAAAVTYSKQRKIIATAMAWMAAHEDRRPMRFDVIEIYTEQDKLNHIVDAFRD